LTPQSAAQTFLSFFPNQDFPSSSEFELDLKIGDLIQVMIIREDGWCKGLQERTQKVGLFPRIFVSKKR
jgi:hypothetical protein